MIHIKAVCTLSKMDKIVRPNKGFIQYLVTIRQRTQLRAILRAATVQEIKVLLEVIGNFVEGWIPFKKDNLDDLEAFQAYLDHTWERRRISVTLKREIMLQNISAILVLLNAVKPYILSI